MRIDWREVGIAIQTIILAGIALGALVLLAVILSAWSAHAQEHQHPPQDVPLHEKFYSGWMMPDEPWRSCCSKRDCYPTESRWQNGHWWALRREDSKWLQVPDAKVEIMRDSPDGRSHVCAPPPSDYHTTISVFCFKPGAGT